MSALPKYFVVRYGRECKLFQNTLYKSATTLGYTVNVIWPVDCIRPKDITMRMRSDNEKSSYIRHWNSQDYKVSKWSFDGSFMEIILRDSSPIIAPIISVEKNEALPYNSCKVIPKDEFFIEEEDTMVYQSAELYSTDPAIPENTVPLSTSVPTSAATVSTSAATVSTSAATVSTSAATVSTTPPVKKGLPSHVANIVLANSISKNELCPITSDPITLENGSVTSCGHVFCKEAIDQWLSQRSSKGQCPICKQQCVL